MSYKPYVANAEAWQRHFMDMAEGKMDHGNSFYKLTRGTTAPSHKSPQSLKVVAPSAQVVEQAKQELRREEREDREQKITGSISRTKPPSKRAKSKLLREPESDFFTD